jgi:hypothetical protein
MRITVESAELLVELDVGGGAKVPARVWRGVTSDGVPCVAFITRVAPIYDTPEAVAAFERDLLDCGRSEIPGLTLTVLANAASVEDPE